MPGRLPFGPRVGLDKGGIRSPWCVGKGSLVGTRGPTLLPSSGPEVNLPHPSAPQRPFSRPQACGEAAPAVGMKWAGLIVGEGRAQSDDLPGFVLLLTPQESELPDLPPSLKQLMEAPLQTGMVRVGGFVWRRGDYNSRRAQHALSRPRENQSASVQAELRFPVCTAGRRASRKRCSPGEGAALAHFADGGVEARADCDLGGGLGSVG